MSSEGADGQSKACAQAEEVPGIAVIEDGRTTGTARTADERRRVRAGTEGCSLRAAAGYCGAQGDPQGNGRHRERGEAACRQRGGKSVSRGQCRLPCRISLCTNILARRKFQNSSRTRCPTKTRTKSKTSSKLSKPSSTPPSPTPSSRLRPKRNHNSLLRRRRRWRKTGRRDERENGLLSRRRSPCWHDLDKHHRHVECIRAWRWVSLDSRLGILHWIRITNYSVFATRFTLQPMMACI
jgi:hypothetical protein